MVVSCVFDLAINLRREKLRNGSTKGAVYERSESNSCENRNTVVYTSTRVYERKCGEASFLAQDSRGKLNPPFSESAYRACYSRAKRVVCSSPFGNESIETLFLTY